VATEYRAFELSPGQLPPTGSTGITLSGTGEIIWVGDVGTFNGRAGFGKILRTDSTPSSTITNRAMNRDEINEYLVKLEAQLEHTREL